MALSTNNLTALKETLRFFSIFAVLSLSLHIVVWLNINTMGAQQLLASAVAAFLQLGGISAQAEGINIVIAQLGIVQIIRDCLGWKAMLAFTALIVATQRRSGITKIKGISTGVFAIIILNIIRLVSTILIVMFLGLQFDFVHSVLWQWSLTISVLGIWALWLFYTKG